MGKTWWVGLVALGLAGCGTAPAVVSHVAPAAIHAADDPDHAVINAIVKDVLTSEWSYLLAHADTDHDGSISQAEFAAGHDAEVTSLFMAQFDANHDGVVTATEASQALASTAAIEAFHHLMEDRMEKAIAPYQGHFGFGELRQYLVTCLGLHGDWPLISKLFGELDLDHDGKLMSSQAESMAFLQKFARAQLQKALALPVTPVE